MLTRDSLRLYLGWGSLLLVAACGGRADDAAWQVGASPSTHTSVATSQTGQGGMFVALSAGGSQSPGGTGSVLTSSPIGGRTSTGGVGAAFGGAAIVAFGGTCAVVYGGTAYTSLVSPTLCGNTILEYSNGEQCDDGNRLSGDGCSSTCRVEPNWKCPLCGRCIVTIICGDGIVGPGEVCDDANTEDGDGCSSTCNEQSPGYVCTPGHPCVLRSTCGNGQLDPGEECDPGSDASVDAGDGGTGCTDFCTLPSYCGDGEVQEGEECDEGADNDSPGCGKCTTACTYGPYCGDGVLQTWCGEVCDDGVNAGGRNACSPGCAAPASYCGDGIVQSLYGEECDDGELNGDGYSKCTRACKIIIYL